MAKATKTTTTKTAAQSKPAATRTTQNKPGSNPAKTAAADASAKSNAYNAKAEAVKAAKDAKAGTDPERRYVVAEGKTVRSKGVRFFGGEAIDLPKSDGDRLKDQGILIDDDKGATAKQADAPVVDESQDGQVPLAPGDAAPAGTGAQTDDGGTSDTSDTSTGDNAGDQQ